MTEAIDRRSALGVLGASLLAAVPGSPPVHRPRQRGKLKQSVCRWIYNAIPLDDFCRQVKEIGIVAIDLLAPHEWMAAKKHGLACSMAFGPSSIPKGFNRVEHHDAFVAQAEKDFPRIADVGISRVIVFSGNKDGMDDAKGIEACVQGLQRIMPLAEKHQLDVCLEYLNSKVDHKDYHFDRMHYGVEVCKGVDSPRMKILYDIYHAQIMEGDVIRTIRDHSALIGHYHTGGVPGRQDIDDTQELNYRAICKAILETGFEGYVAHEFIPKKDAIATLGKAVQLCDV